MSPFEYIEYAALALLGIVAITSVVTAFWPDLQLYSQINSFAELLSQAAPEGGARPFSKYIVQPLSGALRRCLVLARKLGNERYEAALVLFSAAIGLVLVILALANLIDLATDYPDESAIILVLATPILIGLGIWFAGSAAAVDKINSWSAGASQYHDKVRGRESKIARYGLRPAAWGFRKIHELTEQIGDTALRAGARTAAWVYWAIIVLAVTIAAVIAAIEIVLIIAAIAIALVILGAVLGGSSTAGSSDTDRQYRPRERVTRREKDFWGNDKEVVYEDGTKVGEVKIESRGGLLGLGAQNVKVEYDQSGNEVGVRRQEERGGILGIGAENVEVRYDADGNEVGHSRIEERGGIVGIGAEHVRVEYDKDGNEVGQTKWEERGGIFGIGAEKVKVTRDKEPKE